MQNWKDLYLEQANKITDNTDLIQWIDLWHNQVNFLEDEHPFPTPALFFSYRTIDTEDVGQNVQNVKVQVDIYLFYETFADTYKDAFNQESALRFLELMDIVNAVFHGSNGTNYSNMRRLGFAPIDTGNAGNLYRMSYECVLMDYTAVKTYDSHEIEDINIMKSQNPYVID